MIHHQKQMILATRNPHKQRELTQIFQSSCEKIFTLDDFSEIPEVVEDGETFEANAIKKALVVSQYSNLLTLADDSGLSVDALKGEPGIYSKRYSGENSTYQSNINKLFHRLQGIPLKERTASFICCMALVKKGKIIAVVQEKCKGLILENSKGKKGFAYDPIFFYSELNKTFGEMSDQEKNSISHRYKAAQKMINILNQSHNI